EGVECALGRDGELESVADPGVLDLDGEGVLARVPEQEDVDSVALAGRELASLVGGAGHLVPPWVDHPTDARREAPASRRRQVGFAPVPADDLRWYLPTIRTPTQVGGGARERAVLSAHEPL